MSGTIENIAIGLEADAGDFESGLTEAANSVTTAFGDSSAVVAIEAETTGAEPTATIGDALALMTRQSSLIGDTLAAAFARIVPAIENVSREIEFVSGQAKNVRIQAFESAVLARQESGLGKVESRVMAIATSGIKAYKAWSNVSEAVSIVKGVFASGFSTKKLEAGFSAVKMPGRGLAGAGRGLASGAAESVSQAAEEAGGGLSVLSAVLTGGVAGGVAVVTAKVLEWLDVSKWLVSAWDEFKGFALPLLQGLADAISPAVERVAALASATVELVGEWLSAGDSVGGLIGSVTEWIKTTVDGGKLVTNVFHAVASGVATLSDYWGYLKGTVLAVGSVIQSWAASVLRALDTLLGGLGKVANRLGLAEGDWSGYFGGAADQASANAESLMASAGAAFASPSARTAVDSFFKEIETRADAVQKKVADVDLTGWLKDEAKQWNAVLESMAAEASKLIGSLKDPASKLADEFAKLGTLNEMGFLGDDDYDKLKSKAAGQFLGDSATSNSGALDAGSKEARSLILNWQSSQRDPLRELPDLSRQQLESQRRAERSQERIAAALANHWVDPETAALAN